MVHPVPQPPSTNKDHPNKKPEPSNNQNLTLFKRGNAISGDPTMIGTSQLPNPPIIAGMTAKKIITKA